MIEWESEAGSVHFVRFFSLLTFSICFPTTNLVPRACDPWEGNEGSGIIRFREESDWPLKWMRSSILARIPGFRQRIIPEPSFPSQGSQARGTRLPNNRLVETCCDRTKIVCCGQVCRRSDNKLAADLIKTTRDRSVGTSCNRPVDFTDLLQVVLSDLLSLVSNRFVVGCFNKSLRLCCQQLATDLFPQACYHLTKPTDLSRLVDNLPQAGKINSLRQACEISGCVQTY